MFKRTTMALAIATATMSSQAATLLTEGFDSVSALTGTGWTLTSPAGGTGWFQGDQTIFAAQAGSATSYLAANYNSAATGGAFTDLLVSPTFSTASAGTVTFWARADIAPGYADTLRYGFGSGSGSIAYGNAITLSGVWTPYTLSFASGGAGSVGRFGISYFGTADTSNYIGIDSVTVTDVAVVAVPEPSTWALAALGLVAVAGVARRRSGSSAGPVSVSAL